jgi:hypothetical protein
LNDGSGAQGDCLAPEPFRFDDFFFMPSLVFAIPIAAIPAGAHRAS